MSLKRAAILVNCKGGGDLKTYKVRGMGRWWNSSNSVAVEYKREALRHSIFQPYIARNRPHTLHTCSVCGCVGVGINGRY